MKPAVLGIVIILALLITGAFFYGGNLLMPPQQQASDQNIYANGVYGITFQYPSRYLLVEQEVATGHYAITLIEETNATLPENGEGPTAITIDIYEGNDSLTEWLATNESNFGLGDGTHASTSVSGAEALSYRWSGLYEGETTAFLHNGNVIAISVTYMSREDTIRADYYALLATLNLE